jgi:hypothetical protein
MGPSNFNSRLQFNCSTTRANTQLIVFEGIGWKCSTMNKRGGAHVLALFHEQRKVTFLHMPDIIWLN